MAEAAKEALPFYSAAPVIGRGTPLPSAIPASSLRLRPGEGEEAGESPGDQNDAVAGALKKAGLNAADFGTIAHAFLEDRLNSRPPAVPPGILARLKESGLDAVKKEALAMADRFLASELGKKSAAAAYWESEFPFVTAVKAGDRTAAVTGQIDLLFEDDGVLHVVDFKTDRIEKAEDHYGQLAVYKRAAGDIFGKPVRAWLYYLRSGHAVELDLEDVSIEELVIAP
jgi:ATP-dependent helicase/nuclease subunit A